MQELLARAFRETANGSLGDAVLEVSVHSTKSETLTSYCTCLNEGIVSKSAVVGMVLAYTNTVFGREAFEGSLGLNCLLRRQRLHQMDILQL